MFTKKGLAGATLMAKVTQIIMCGITFGESYRRLQEYNNCDYIGVTLSTVLITHFLMEILILGVLYFSKPMGIHLFIAKLISISIVIAFCACFAIFHVHNKYHVLPENPEKKIPVKASWEIIGLMVWVVILDAFTVYFAAKVSNYISEEIKAEEQGIAPPANDPENAAAGNEPMDAALPNEALPNEALPNEALPNEVIPNEAIPNEVLANEEQNGAALNEPIDGAVQIELENVPVPNDPENIPFPIDPENVPLPNDPENVLLPNDPKNKFVQNDQQNNVELPVNAGVANDGEIANEENMHSVEVEDDVELIDQQNALRDKEFNASTARLDDIV